MFIIIILIILAILCFNLFVYLLGLKINFLEKKIIKLFQRRTNEMVGIYQTTKNDLVKSKEIFETFFDLKRREFAEDSLENKLVTYSKIHNEINFIFKTCERHRKIQLNPIYIFLRDGIIEKSQEIGKNMKLYEGIKEKHEKYKNIAKFTLVGNFY